MALWVIRRAIIECEKMSFSDICPKIDKKIKDVCENEEIHDEALLPLTLYKFWKKPEYSPTKKS
ncbi:MAG: hypothetical protein Q6362_011715 [Candidatus Wukongarchaeota archaeon]|nr:hypothetical protein [Candidatus Wukongarchaeota archaeon]MDO8130077.1 hypothetical protein [Candidatus Wukongarchaeota archaeon]